MHPLIARGAVQNLKLKIKSKKLELPELTHEFSSITVKLYFLPSSVSVFYHWFSVTIFSIQCHIGEVLYWVISLCIQLLPADLISVHK